MVTSYDNSYSRFIAMAKIVLPLAGLGLLSTLFLFSRNIDPTRSIPYSQVDVDQIVREQRIKSPDYNGVTSDGTAIRVIAETARPDVTNPNRASAEALVARLEFSDGGFADITAEAGVIDTAIDEARLRDGVVIDTSTGYHIVTERLKTALSETRLSTDTTVTADGPLGHLTAGRMELYPNPDAPGSYVVVFNDDVKLIYDPQE